MLDGTAGEWVKGTAPPVLDESASAEEVEEALAANVFVVLRPTAEQSGAILHAEDVVDESEGPRSGGGSRPDPASIVSAGVPVDEILQACAVFPDLDEWVVTEGTAVRGVINVRTLVEAAIPRLPEDAQVVAALAHDDLQSALTMLLASVGTPITLPGGLCFRCPEDGGHVVDPMDLDDPSVTLCPSHGTDMSAHNPCSAGLV